MILVDIWVPALDKSYDFQLDENLTIEVLLGEIGELICQKEQCQMKGNIVDLMLWNADNGMKLNGQVSLGESGIRSGDRLLLV